ACRSAANRASTCLLSIPALTTLTATRRRIGWAWSAIQTVPIPPSPICCSSLYGPTPPPAPSSAAPESRGGAGPGRAPAGRAGGQGVGRPLQEAAQAGVGGQQRLHPRAEVGIRAARLVEEGPSLGGVGLVEGGNEDLALGHGRAPER